MYIPEQRSDNSDDGDSSSLHEEAEYSSVTPSPPMYGPSMRQLSH